MTKTGKDWKTNQLMHFPDIENAYKDGSISLDEKEIMYRFRVYYMNMFRNWLSENELLPERTPHDLSKVQEIFFGLPAIKRLNYAWTGRGNIRILAILKQISTYPSVEDLKKAFEIYDLEIIHDKRPEINPTDMVNHCTSKEFQSLLCIGIYDDDALEKKGIEYDREYGIVSTHGLAGSRSPVQITSGLFFDFDQDDSEISEDEFLNSNTHDQQMTGSELYETAKTEGFSFPEIIEQNPGLAMETIRNFGDLWDRGYNRISLDQYMKDFLGIKGNKDGTHLLEYLLVLSRIKLNRELYIEQKLTDQEIREQELKTGRKSKGIKLIPWSEGCGYEVKGKERAILGEDFYFLPIQVRYVRSNDPNKRPIATIELLKKPELLTACGNHFIQYPRKALQHTDKAPYKHNLACFVETDVIPSKKRHGKTNFSLQKIYEITDFVDNKNKKRPRQTLSSILEDHRQAESSQVYKFFVPEREYKTKKWSHYYYIWKNDAERNHDIKEYGLPLEPIPEWIPCENNPTKKQANPDYKAPNKRTKAGRK